MSAGMAGFGQKGGFAARELPVTTKVRRGLNSIADGARRKPGGRATPAACRRRRRWPLRSAATRLTLASSPAAQLPMERANPLLSCVMSKWLKAHGKASQAGACGRRCGAPVGMSVHPRPCRGNHSMQTVKPKLSDDQRDSLQKCFRIMDADGSGAIDAEELDAAFKLLGLMCVCRVRGCKQA